MELGHSCSSVWLGTSIRTYFLRFIIYIQGFEDASFFVMGSVHIDSTMHMVTLLIPRSVTIGTCMFVCI